MRKVKNFQIAKDQPQVVAKLLLDFLLFQVGVAYKSVAYKESMYILTPPVTCTQQLPVFKG